MDVRGTITAVSKDYSTGKVQFTAVLSEGNAEAIDALRGEDAKISISKWRNSRSKDANALLWACLGKIAAALGGDKWDYYIDSLRKYGKSTLVTVSREAIGVFQTEWRACEIVGERNGRLDVLCYYGSSTYDTKEFSALLDGVIEDMRQAGIDTPTQEELQRALDAWERSRNEQKQTKD